MRILSLLMSKDNRVADKMTGRLSELTTDFVGREVAVNVVIFFNYSRLLESLILPRKAGSKTDEAAEGQMGLLAYI